MSPICHRRNESIPALTSPHVFACHCEVEASSLKVGILAVGEEFEFGQHTIYGQDETEFFTVEILSLTDNPSYGVSLPLVNV